MNRVPSTGMSFRNGTPDSVSVLASRMKPPSRIVSPSRTEMVELASRSVVCGAFMPALPCCPPPMSMKPSNSEMVC